MIATHPAPRQDPGATAVRQGVMLGAMRWVLLVSLACAVVGLIVARLLA